MSSSIRSNLDVVVYAVGLLGGAHNLVSTEAIAYQAFQLAPGRFSWVSQEFRHFPDKLVTKTALEDAAKKQYGALVRGKYKRDAALGDGWSLTAEGVRWLEENQERIKMALQPDDSTSVLLPPREVQRLQTRLRKERAFHIYRQTGSLRGVTRVMFTELLRCSPDAPPDLVAFKLDRLRAEVELTRDEELVAFLEACGMYYQEKFVIYEREG